MLKYFLAEEEQEPSEATQNLLKTHHIHKRKFTPFHFNCELTKRKLCRCPALPAAKIAPENRVKLWQFYQPIHDFYSGTHPEHISSANKTVPPARLSTNTAAIKSVS